MSDRVSIIENYITRKPQMSAARRKVLNLLEFVAEADPGAFSIYEIVRDVGGEYGRDLSDEELGERLEKYGDRLIADEIARHRDET